MQARHQVWQSYRNTFPAFLSSGKTVHRTFLPPSRSKISPEPVRRIFKIPFRCLLWYDKYFSYHGCRCGSVHIQGYKIPEQMTAAFLSNFCFQSDQYGKHGRDDQENTVDLRNKNAFYICSPHIYFFPNGKVCKFRIRPSTSCILRIPFPAAQNRKKRDHINDCISIDPQTSRLLSAPAINHGKKQQHQQNCSNLLLTAAKMQETTPPAPSYQCTCPFCASFCKSRAMYNNPRSGHR